MDDNIQLPPVQPGPQQNDQSASTMQDPSQQPGPQQPILQQLPQAQVPPQASVPAKSEHKDLIDKAWVSQIKQTVNQHRHDPHEQSKRLNVIRAEFLKRQYNKDIKVEPN